MLAFHSVNYDSVVDAIRNDALYKTPSVLEGGTYTNLYDYLEIIETFAKCMGIEKGEYEVYIVDTETRKFTKLDDYIEKLEKEL